MSEFAASNGTVRHIIRCVTNGVSEGRKGGYQSCCSLLLRRFIEKTRNTCMSD